MKKKILSMLLVLALCAALLPVLASAAGPDIWDGSTAAKLTGTGTSEDDPFLISTGAELKLLAENSRTMDFGSRYVKLTNDIILNDGVFDRDGNFTKTGESGTSAPNEWLPAGQATWHIDGDGHYISGLYIKLNEDRIGLFSYIYNGGYIKDLTIKNSYVFSTKSGAYVGVFAGKSFRTSFINCAGENNIVATNGCYSTAGVVGWAEAGSFSGVHTSGSVSGNNILGGIAGRTMDTTFKNCWNETNIDNEKASIRQSGGIAGMASSASFYNCANLGYLHGGSRVGGIVAEANNVKVKNCYGLSDIADTSRDWGSDNGTWRYFYRLGTLVGTEGATVTLSFAQDGYERNDYGENGVVPHFTGKGDLGGGDEGELLDALNANLNKMEGESGLNEWVRTGDGYPLPIGGTFVDTSKYYDIWLDGVRVGERNEADILENGLASYDSSTNTLYLHDGLTVTNGDAAENSLLLANGDLNLCIDGTVRFISNLNISSGASVIDMGIDVGGSGALRIYAPEGKSASVSVVANNPSYGLDLASLTLDGSVSMTVRTNLAPCFAFCNTFTFTSPQAMLDAVNLGGGFAMLNAFTSINLPGTNAQKFYEGSADELTRVDRFTTQKEVEGKDEPQYFMYPHIRIAPEVSEAYDSLPASLTVSMDTANDAASLKTWAETQLSGADCFESVAIDGVVPASAGTFASPAGTNGSFTAAVTVLKNGVRLTRSIPGTITATEFVQADITVTAKAGTVSAEGVFTERADGVFEYGETVQIRVYCKSGDNDAAGLNGTLTLGDTSIPLTWNAAGSYTADGILDLPAPGSYDLTAAFAGNEEYLDGSAALTVTVGKYTPRADDFIFTPPAETVYDGSRKTASVAFGRTGLEPVGEIGIEYFIGGAKTDDVSNAGEYTVKISTIENDYYNAVTGLSSDDWKFTIRGAEVSDVTAPAARTLTYNGSAQALVDAGSAVNGTVMYSLSETGGFTADVPTGTGAGVYTAYWYVKGDANYADTAVSQVSAVIAAKGLGDGVTAERIADRTYSGSALTPDVTLTDGETKLVYGTDYTTAYENNRDAGIATVRITGKGNYCGEMETRFEIEPQRLIGLSFDNITVTKVYDGTAAAGTLSGSVGFSGRCGSDDVAIAAVPGDYAEDDINAGENKRITLTLSLTGESAKNYELGSPTAAFTNAEITRAAGSVTAPAAEENLVYTGEALTLISAASDATGEIQYSLTGSDGDYGAELPSAVNAGTYTVYYRVLQSENYNAVPAGTVTAVIGKAAVTISAADKTAYIGDSLPDLSDPEEGADFTVSGLLGGDALITSPTLRYDPAAPDMGKAGTAAIIAEGADAGNNYDIEYTNGTLTIAYYPVMERYPISITESEHGSVTSSAESASMGSSVTLSVKPDSGYVLETLTVTGSNGTELALTDMGGGRYVFTMPGGAVTVSATFMEDNSILNFFYDVPNDAYYFDAVKWAAENGITSGVGDGLFAPDLACTRAQIVTFLWRAAGEPEPESECGFTDVPADSYYAKAVAWAVENGITNGTGDGKFSPDDTCTRAQGVTFLWRAAGKPVGTAGGFSDVPAGSYYAGAVAWAVENGITNGTGNGRFSPDAPCTRAQIVTFLYRAEQAR